MPIQRASSAGLAFFLLALSAACGSGSRFQFSGKVANSTVSARSRGSRGELAIAKHVSHIMAVNSQLASPDRVLAPVAADGSFSIKVDVDKPYFLVLIDNSQVGPEMIVAILAVEGLKAFVSTTPGGGSVDLGNVTANGDTKAASVSASYQAVLAALGITADDASFLKTIQATALRYANPDIDGNGKIDLEEGKTFSMDFHVRSNMFLADGTTRLKVSDMTNQFYPDNAKVVFNLSSAYVGFPSSFDSTNYMPSSGRPGAGLAMGAAFAASDPAGPVSPPSSYSSLSYGDMNGFGADYQLTDAGVELPGSSSGSVATYVYTLGHAGAPVTLTFSNVGTRKKADLESDGTVVPFVKFNTVAPGDKRIASVGWQFMKLSAGVWQPATATEVTAVVNDNGGYAGFYDRAKENQIGCPLARTPAGTIALSDCHLQGAASASGVTTDDICSMAISYDDKLGLRIFAGDAAPNDGVAPCY